MTSLGSQEGFNQQNNRDGSSEGFLKEHYLFLLNIWCGFDFIPFKV